MTTRYFNFVHIPNTLAMIAALLAAASYFLAPDWDALAEAQQAKTEAAAATVRETGGAVLDLGLLLLLRPSSE